MSNAIPRNAVNHLAANHSKMPTDNDYRTFFIAMVVALAMHIAGMVVWQVMGIWESNEVAVRVLKIRLGDAMVFSSSGNTATVEDQSDSELGATLENESYDVDPSKVNNTAASAESVEEAQEIRPSKPLLQDKAKVEAKPVEKPIERTTSKPQTPKKVEKLEAAAQVPENKETTESSVRKVRPRAAESGSVLGNTNDAAAEVIARYEQTISAWVHKHQRYTEQAKREDANGTAVVRIRINRSGNVVYRRLEKKSGFAVLDREAMNMIQRSDPVPRPPANYPVGSSGLVEFLIPIKFGG